MAVSYMDFTSPNVQFAYDVNQNRTFTKDSSNYINALGIQQLNTLGNASLLDIYLSAGNVVEPHVHQNASELVYLVSGAAVVSILNPFTKEVRNFALKPGQVALVPQGWFHWEMATENQTHIIAIFDAPIPEFIAVSDFLRLAPRNLLAHTYCLDESLITAALAPIKETTTIGPPANCGKPVASHSQSRFQYGLRPNGNGS
ncbi:cupin domain-containing protein [Cohnella sp. GCM10020058]|uniref:cupin domain-containing protein n=1 Tax=Cohnella sp. GCM10020058 TaxID=3317330 RepID=UPI003644281B